jgi:precorrin-2 dehydrogenase/sirohydrochlorin ferrochelatase
MAVYFPAFLDLRGRRCLVVGGGEIGERKARSLLDSGAEVTLVSPAVTPGLSALATAGLVRWRARGFRKVDVRGCRLVIAATGVAAVDTVVAVEANRRGALANVVDRPAECDFIFPSILRRGHLQIAVSTGGRSPALAREIRRSLERLFGPEYAALVERVGLRRRRALAVAATPAERRRAGEAALAAWP